MRLNEALETAASIEAELAECYELMSRMDPREEIQIPLKILAQEEISHLNAIKAGRNYLYKAPEEFGETRVPIKDLQDGLEWIRKFRRELTSDKTDLRSALQTMYSLELSYEKVHLSTLMSIKNSDLKRLFQALCDYDKDHRKRLEGILEQV